RFALRMINIHPALLPAFGGPGMYGRRVHERVLASGAAISGATVHYVDEEYDHGPIIAQWPVPVRPGDTPDTLAARVLEVARRVHVIDTFVSADSPLELPNFAVAPIGQGVVARALDNSSITPPAYVDSLVQVARARGVKLQVGTTNGGNDGSVFTPYGVVDVAMGWPLRYSRSPAEVVDLRDVVSLADMIQAVGETW